MLNVIHLGNETLDYYETQINDSLLVIADCLEAIYTKQLYLQVSDTWQDYLLTRWSMSYSKYKRLKIDTRVIRYLSDFANVWQEQNYDYEVPAIETQSHARALNKFDSNIQPAILLMAQSEATRQNTKLTSGVIEQCGQVLARAIDDGVVSIDGEDTPALAIATFEAVEELKKRQQQHRDSHYHFIRIEAKADGNGHIAVNAPECANMDVILTIRYKQAQ